MGYVACFIAGVVFGFLVAALLNANHHDCE